jgi:hypothetical protein
MEGSSANVIFNLLNENGLFLAYYPHFETRSLVKNQSPTFLDTTRAILKTTLPTILLLLRVYSLPR